jgi:repressor LexA
MSEELTDRQMQVLKFINAFRASEQCNPTCDEIKNSFGWSSANAAHDHLVALRKHGVIDERKSIFGWQKRSRGYIVLAPWDQE